MIKGNSQLDGRHQHHRHGNGAEHNGHNQKDGGNGNDVRYFKVHRRGFNQVVGHRRLAGNHGSRVIGFYNRRHLRQLLCHLVGGRFVAGVDHHHLIAPLLQHIPNLRRDKKVGDARPQQGVIGNQGRDPRQRLQFLLHGAHILGGDIVPQYDKVGGGHIKLFLQLGIAHNGGQVPGQGFVQLIIHPRMVLRINRRDKQNQRQHGKGHPVPQHKAIQPVEFRNDGFVGMLFQLVVQQQHQGRQHQNHRGHPQHHALGHHNANIPAQGQPHKAQGQKPGNGSQAAPRKGTEGRQNGLGHSLFFIGTGQLLLLVPAVQKDGVVHGHAQLQHRRNGLGNIRNLAQQDVGAKVIKHRQPNVDD